jgi:hypothetical protein
MGAYLPLFPSTCLLDYVYPLSANVLGIMFALTSASAIPIVGVYMLYRNNWVGIHLL